MKKNVNGLTIAIFVIIVVVISSCSGKKMTQDAIVKKNLEAYIKENMNDPNSYEFVKLELTDSITYNDNINYRKKYFNDDIKYNSTRLESQEMYKTEIPSMYNEDEVAELKSKIEQNKIILNKIDSIAISLKEKKNNVASYTYEFSFRGKNTLGSKILNRYYVQTNSAPDFEIINVVDDLDKMFLNPNDFPGYRDMIKKIQ